MSLKDRVFIDLGDIVEADCEAVVNAANNELWMGGGVAGALKRAGGVSIEQEAVRQGPVAVGECVITAGGKLKALNVIHAAAMAPGREATAESVRTATANALKLAVENDIDSIAFPALGTGVGGLGFADCAEVMLDAIKQHCAAQDKPFEIHILLWGQNALAIFKEALKKLV